MAELVPDLEQIRREYDSGQVRPPTAATSSRLKRAVTAPKKSRLRVAKLELILIVVVLGVAAAIYVASLRNQKTPALLGGKNASPTAHEASMRGKGNVRSEKPLHKATDIRQ